MAAALPKLSDEGEALYTSMLKAAQNSSEGLKKVFFQSDLQTLADEAAKTVGQLLVLIQELTDHCLVRASRLDKALCWSTRSRSAASAIRVLNPQEKLVYTTIEDAHTKGIWMRDLKRKTGLQKECEKALSKLEGARLIKSIRNVKAPAQKTFMLYHLVPGDDVTGGSFFDAGDLDESLIDELSNLIIFHVKQQSWVDAKTRRAKREDSPIEIEESVEPAAKKRRRHTNDIEDSVPPAKKHRSRRHDHPAVDIVITQLPYQAYTRTYPSAQAIHSFITESDAIRASKANQLTVAEVQGVIDVLVWDDKLEKVGDGYRTIRGISFRHPGMMPEVGDGELDGVGNGLTQTPCGRCPVFDLCTEDGPLNPGNCVYWQEWLAAGR